MKSLFKRLLSQVKLLDQKFVKYGVNLYIKAESYWFCLFQTCKSHSGSIFQKSATDLKSPAYIVRTWFPKRLLKIDL